MKQFRLLITLSALLVMFSCTAPLSSRLEDYVTNVENNSSEWTEEEWALSKQEYEKLLEEYSANRDSYTAEEKEAINKAIGRYNGLLIKQGFSDVEKYIKELGEDIPNLLDGFFGAFEGTE
jgi:hypothetical protein